MPIVPLISLALISATTIRGKTFGCLASAVDVYAVGKLSQAGEETDFLHDSLESFGYYYDQYAAREHHLQDLMAAILAFPFETMIKLARFLYGFGRLLLDEKIRPSSLAAMLPLENDMFYPLVHHYQMTNWILTFSARSPHGKMRRVRH